MRSAVNNSCWNLAFEKSGPLALDRVRRWNSSWDDFLVTGEADFAKGVEIGGLTVGSARTALELACGVGRVTDAPGRKYCRAVGADIAPGMIEHAETQRRLANVSFVVSNRDSVAPQSIGTFDSVFSYEVLYYVPAATLIRYFAQVFTLRNPGGEFVFQLNVERISPKTRLSIYFRHVLFTMGVAN
jgi:SAM-dependent methyltransferase